MKKIAMFVGLQMLTTLFLIYLFSFFAYLSFDNKNMVYLLSSIFLTSAFVAGAIPCFIGAFLNKSPFFKISNFKLKSILSWAVSFVLTLVVAYVGGVLGEISEILGRFFLILPSALIACSTWIYYSSKFLKD